MYSKITEENIEQIQEGTLIWKYSKDGNPFDVFDETDKDNINDFIVSKEYFDSYDLSFPPPKYVPHVAGMVLDIGPIHKNKKALIEEGYWWIKDAE